MKTRRHGEHGDGYNFSLCSPCLRVFICLLFAWPSQAAKKPVEPAPPLTYSTPLAAAPGKITDVTFEGAVSGDAVGLWTSFPAEVTALPPEGGKIRYSLKLAEDVPVGIG